MDQEAPSPHSPERTAIPGRSAAHSPPDTNLGSTWVERLRRTVLVLGLTAASARILWVVNAFDPIVYWLVWPVLGYWAVAAYLTAGCLGLGLRVVTWLGVQPYSNSERTVLGLAVGVLTFSLLLFILGITVGLPRGLCLPLPLLGIASYGSSWSTLYRQLKAGVAHQLRTGLKWSHAPLLALLALVGAAVYLPILTPYNIQYDAHWYHFPIASQYAAQGRIAPFSEGWLLGAYPHLASLLYTWVLLWPLDIAQRLGIAAHLEFLLFLYTVASVPVLVRRLRPSCPSSLSLLTFALFPGYLVYDASLTLGADHVAAIWAVPILLVLLQLGRSQSPPRIRDAGLLGALVAGAALTKYSTICLVAPAGVGLIGLLVRAGLPHPLGRNGRGPGPAEAAPPHTGLGRASACLAAAGLSLLIGFAPHWLKNWLWYGDPIYPLLHGHLDAHPWNPTTAKLFADFHSDMVIHGSRDLAGVLSGLWAGISYGFQTREYDFHGQRPVFGFLFGALLPLMPFVRVGKKTWFVAGLAVLGVAAWYLTYHRDRYLQALLPWFVAVVAVLLHSLWQLRSRAIKWTLGVLLGLQLLLGLDVFFLRSHNMARDRHPLEGLMDQLTAGNRGDGAARSALPRGSHMEKWAALNRALPQDAVLLVHREHLWLGLDRAVVSDESGWQAAIDYDRIPSARALWQLLHKLGVTHILVGQRPYSAEVGPLTPGGELRLWNLLYHSPTVPLPKLLKGWRLWQLPSTPPPASSGDDVLVAWYTCSDSKLERATGVYALHALGLQAPSAAPTTATQQASEQTLQGSPAEARQPRNSPAEARQARFAVTENGCKPPPGALRGRTRLSTLGAATLWWTAPPHSSPTQAPP